MIEKPTDDEFRALLKAHDQLYMYSDDNRAYRKGLDESKHISAILREHPSLKWIAIEEHYYA